MSNQKGFSKVAIIIIVVILIGGAYFIFNKKEKNIPAQNIENESSQSSQSLGGDLSMSDWKTYRNEEYGFEFKYPKELQIVGDAEGIGKYMQDKGMCSISHEIILNNPLLPKLTWEAGTDGRIPRLSIRVQKNDCQFIFDTNWSLPPQVSRVINELLNVGIDKQKISEALFPGLGWNAKKEPEYNCKDISVVNVVDEKINYYGVKSSECYVGPVHPETSTSFVPVNNFIVEVRDEASKYQKDGIFDQILSTFKFTK